MSITEGATNGKWVGQSLRRKEDPRMITGRGRYVDDMVVAGMLYMAVVRSPEAHAKVVSIDASGAKELPGVYGVWSADDLDLAGPIPMVWVPPGVEVKAPEHWPLAKDEVNYVGQAVAIVIGDSKYGVVDAAEQVLVEYEPLPVVVDPEKALEEGAAARPRGHRHQRRPRVDDRRRRHGRGLERGRGHRRAADRQPPLGRHADRAALADRRLADGPADAAHHEPEPAPDPPLHGRRVRHVGGPHPRDRAGRGRRLRREDHALRRGDPRGVGVEAAQPPGQVDGDALGAHDLDRPRPRPDRLREDRRQARRHDHRARLHGDLRLRRVPHDPHAVHPVVHRVRDQRLLQDPEPQLHGQGRLHQQDVDRRHARRRAAGGDAPDRDDDRAARGRAGHGLARAAAEELHPQGGLPGRGGDRHRLRLRRLPRLARQAPDQSRPRRVPRRAGGAAQ